jgi:methylaspartate mutase epsilon subunit
MEIRNQRLDDKDFARRRKEVLATWPTGSGVDLDEAVGFHRGMKPHKNFALRLLKAREDGATLIRSESGVPDAREFTDYLLFLQNESGIDLLGTMVDSMTRNQRYQAAEEGLQESLRRGKWALNGFPMVSHGVGTVRKLIESVDRPVMIRGISPDYRLINEIGFAGGHTGTSGTPLMAFCQYSSNLPLETVIDNYQYAYRLMGSYAERGVPLTASITGGFAILCPFSVLIAGAILDSIIAAEQGVISLNFSMNAQGNLVQDVATMHACRRLAQEYLGAMGYRNTQVTMNCTNWSGQFPQDVFAASVVISLGVFAAVASRSEVTTLKTIEEAKSIPTREGNAASIRAAKTMITMLQDQELHLDEKAVEEEARMLESEARLIVDRILEMGKGDVAIGEMRAIESGVFDVPFSTSKFVPCKVQGIRDRQGMVRYFATGNLPFTPEILAFHKEKVAERGRAVGKVPDYQAVVADLSSISKGYVAGRDWWSGE